MSNLMSNYKLTPDIIEFIISQKKSNVLLSCRGLIPLVCEKFNITLSKSLISSVLKSANLNGRVGRRKIKEKPAEFIINGGLVFLKAADLKLSLMRNLTNCLAPYFPNTKLDLQQKINEILTYMEFFKTAQSTPGKRNFKKLGLWWLLDGVISQGSLIEFYKQLSQITLLEAENTLKKMNFDCKGIVINELYKKCLYRLNAYAQTNFFPNTYQFLDPFAMKERFYSLLANIEKKPHLLKIHLFYPTEFFWVNDIIWQEGFSYAAAKVNSANIFNENGERIWIDPAPKFLSENAFNPK